MYHLIGYFISTLSCIVYYINISKTEIIIYSINYEPMLKIE